MTIAGGAAVAIWHDLKPAAKAEFYQWHAREHMPERVAIPGFNRGRRYVAVEGAPEFFNLYEADSMAVLGGADYLERLNNPTPWTQAVVASFVGVARATCDVLFTAGEGEGGHIATLRFEAPEGACATLAQSLLPELAAQGGIAAVHLLVADDGVSNLETRERAARGNATDVPRKIVLIEGVDAAHVGDAARELAGAIAAPVDLAIYVLEHETARRPA